MLSPIVEPVLRYFIKILAFFITVRGGVIMYCVIEISKTLSYDLKLTHSSRALI